MSALAPIGRYLARTGRVGRARELARGADDIALLDELDDVEGLIALGSRLTPRDSMELGQVARALARRRRFDALGPLLPRTPGDGAWAIIDGALAGLWDAGGDAATVRDLLLPAAEATGAAVGRVAEALVLLGDRATAMVIVERRRAAALALDEIARIGALAEIAPALALLDGAAAGHALLAEASRLYDRVFDEDWDGYGIPSQNAIAGAHRRIAHLEAIRGGARRPWRHQRPVSARFAVGRLGVAHRYGEGREEREEREEAIDHRLECADFAAAMELVDDKHLLARTAPRIPAGAVDDAMARRLVEVARSLPAGTDAWVDGAVAAVAVLLAEAGRLDDAALLASAVRYPEARARALAACASCLSTTDRARAARLAAEAAAALAADDRQFPEVQAFVDFLVQDLAGPAEK